MVIGVVGSPAERNSAAKETVEGAMPAPGTLVMLGEKEAGEMRSGRDGHALAMLRLEMVEAAKESGPLTAGAAKVTAHLPAWVKLPEPEAKTET